MLPTCMTKNTRKLSLPFIHIFLCNMKHNSGVSRNLFIPRARRLCLTCESCDSAYLLSRVRRREFLLICVPSIFKRVSTMLRGDALIPPAIYFIALYWGGNVVYWVQDCNGRFFSVNGERRNEVAVIEQEGKLRNGFSGD